MNLLIQSRKVAFKLWAPMKTRRRPVCRIVMFSLAFSMLCLTDRLAGVESASLNRTGWLDINRLLTEPLKLFDSTSKLVENEFVRLGKLSIDSGLTAETVRVFARTIDTIIFAVDGTIELALSTVNRSSSAISPWMGFMVGGITDAITELLTKLAEFVNQITDSFLALVVRVLNNTTTALNDIALRGLFSMLQFQLRILEHSFELIQRMFDSGRSNVAIKLLEIVNNIVRNVQTTVGTLLSLGEQRLGTVTAQRLGDFVRKINDALLSRLEDHFNSINDKCQDGNSGLDIILELRIRIRSYRSECDECKQPKQDDQGDFQEDDADTPDTDKDQIQNGNPDDSEHDEDPDDIGNGEHETPIEPEAPIEPEQFNEPNDPETPEEPEEPGRTDEPESPNEPENPEEPEEPGLEMPEEPTEIENPGETESPDELKEPEKENLEEDDTEKESIEQPDNENDQQNDGDGDGKDSEQNNEPEDSETPEDNDDRNAEPAPEPDEVHEQNPDDDEVQNPDDENNESPSC